jgi:hypothetical protein
MMITNNKQAGKWEKNGNIDETILILFLTTKSVTTKPMCDCIDE